MNFARHSHVERVPTTGDALASKILDVQHSLAYGADGGVPADSGDFIRMVLERVTGPIQAYACPSLLV